MKVGIIGAGMIGGTLVRRLTSLGHDVVVANSRGPETLRALAAETGARAVTLHEAARNREIVVVTIPERAVPDLPKDLFAGVPADVVVIDTGNYYPARDGAIPALDAGQVESVWVAEHLGRPVIKAFNHIYFKSLLEDGTPAGTPGRLALAVAGDPPQARATVMRLVDELGFDPVDAGALEESWRQQPGTPAYLGRSDADTLKVALAAADRSRFADYRTSANDAVKAIFAKTYSRTRVMSEAGGVVESQAGLVQMPVVAVGMSAGGLEAFTTFLARTPADTGLAFVLVQHLDPNRESLLVELLAKATPMPVVEIHDGMKVERNRVHVMPPGVGLTVTGTTLHLLPRVTGRVPMPIDAFLRTLADDRHAQAIAVILSGTGSDGTLGVQAIREHGGLVFVQSPEDAAFPGMPVSAIATGAVDLVLPAAQLGAEVARLVADPAGVLARAAGLVEDAEVRSHVLTLLRAATGVDFSRYRVATVDRRMNRRRALLGLGSLAAYRDVLRANPAELQKLAQDLLISVTRFFRDPSVFDTLSSVTWPDLIRHATDGVVRVWVPGCSTGEEVYSLAITFVEAAQRMRSPVTCQIFATDINDVVLQTARRGIYPENIAADVSSERLERWFVRGHGGYQIGSAIRNLCVFSRHDLLNDPPLSQMDLVSCRNVLIYLEGAHRDTLAAFHFALRPLGVLLLGHSETAASRSDLFEEADKAAHLFRALRSTAGRGAQGTLSSRSSGRREPAPPTPSLMPNMEAAYEELVATNEELLSLNEELESAKEEVESTSEELRTLNQELRERNTELQEAYAFTEATLDTVRGGLVVLDRHLRVVSANRTFCRTFHVTKEEVAGRLLVDLVPEFRSAGIQALLMNEPPAATSHDNTDVDVDVARLDGRRRVLAVGLRRLVSGDRLLVSVDDVTDARKAQADLREFQKMEALGHLAAGVAHDFNNLMTTVVAGSSMLLAELSADTSLQPVVEAINLAGLRAAELTRQILAYAGKARVLLERVQLSDTVVETVNLLHGSVPRAIQIRLNLARDLPLLLADASQVHQVVSNLITNAVEAIGDASGTVSVMTGRQHVSPDEVEGIESGTMLAPGEYVFLEVTDSGIGMSVETQRQMFDPFFTTKFRGRGLGLSAVQGIVRTRRGAITVHSVPGKGTTMRVLLPAEVIVPAVPTAPTPARSGGETILLVEGESIVLRIAAAALRDEGYQVLAATREEEACDQLRANAAIAVVVLDVDTDGVNGLATLQKLRAIRPGIPVVVTSPLGEVELEPALAGSDVAGVLHKPFTGRALVGLVGACFRG